jgi:sugar phosphate isomerase/epimerase
MQSSNAEIEYGLKAAKMLGASHVSLEHPGNDAHTLKLGTMAQKHGMKVAYHGHEQQTPTFWDTALTQSPANALNLDIGHYTAAGYNAVELVQAKHDRILSMHIKDRQNPEHGKGNLPWGTGDTPIVQVLQLMKKNKYNFPATIELEYKIPEGIREKYIGFIRHESFRAPLRCFFAQYSTFNLDYFTLYYSSICQSKCT